MKKLTINEVKRVAKGFGLILDKSAKKSDIIRTIQAVEGNSPCFGTEAGKNCGQENCYWRADCLEA